MNGFCPKKKANSYLLTNVNVQQFISEGRASRSKRTEVTQDRVLLEIARAFDANNNLLCVQDWPDDVAAAISSIKVVEIHSGNESDVVSYLKEIKFWDKGKQIELAGRHLGMFTDKMLLTLVNPANLLSELKLKDEAAKLPDAATSRSKEAGSY